MNEVGYPPAEQIKVALFIPNFRIGGAERQMFELAKRLDPHKYRVTVIALHGDGQLKELFYALPHLRLVTLERKTYLGRLWQLVNVSRREEIQVLHAFLKSTDVYALFAKVALRHTKMVIGLRDSILDSTIAFKSQRLKMKVRTLDLLLKLLRHLGDLYVANSEAGKALYEKRLRLPVAVVPNGIDTDRFRPDDAAHSLLCSILGEPPNSKFVGILANCTIHKDYPTFVQAARIVYQETKDVRFVALGDNRTSIGSAVRDLVQKSGLQSVFHFLGVRNDVHHLLPGLEVLCSSSVTEGFSAAIAEAMACGAPCVVTDAGDSRIIVGGAGIVVPPRNPKKLAEGVLNILNLRPEERIRLKASARQRIVERFHTSLMAKQYEHLYEVLVFGRNREWRRESDVSPIPDANARLTN